MGLFARVGVCWALLAASVGAHALQISRFSPQGEVAVVRQVVVKFDRAAIRFGDPAVVAPLTLSCSDAESTRGTGRWTSDREWVFDFARDLPPGVRCTTAANPSFQPLAGSTFSGPHSYAFNSGGPSVRSITPDTYEAVDEEQVFVLRLTGAATQQSLLAHVWCTAEGVGERIPVRWVEGESRDAILKAVGWTKEAKAQPQQYPTLGCNRRLTAGSRMQLVYGEGVASPSGVVHRTEQSWAYRVREPFTAEFRCERESAQSACLPIRALRLSFNASVPRELALAVRLKAENKVLLPHIDGEAEGASDSLVSGLRFAPTLAENTVYTLELPSGFKDASGRILHNADLFPMKVQTSGMPPLAKFAAAPFGIVERFAEGSRAEGLPALLPVTLRKVESNLAVRGLQAGTEPAGAGQVRTLRPGSDSEILAWYKKVLRYDAFAVERKQARRDVSGPLPKPVDVDDKDHVQTRMVSLLAGRDGVRMLELAQPAGNDPRPFEVVGIPLAPGFHVVEIASQTLGGSLLDERHGSSRTMYVRTATLVTNLGVHFKLGRENALAWVTTLDKGQPVAGANVRVSDCQGREVAQAMTDELGRARLQGLDPEPEYCSDGSGVSGYFVTARHRSADGVEDMAFTLSEWQKGIEPWRFQVPTSMASQRDERAHTVFDRTLLRAGETVSMKHLLRLETANGFALPQQRPAQMVITHVGSGQEFTQPLNWRATPTGGLSAHTSFAVPSAAKLGVYQVRLRTPDADRFEASTGEFRVEEFRLPVLQGRIAPVDQKPLVRARSVPAEVQVNYVSGGAAAQLPVRVTALLRSKALQYRDHESFSFQPPRPRDQAGSSSDEEEESARQDARVIADKLPLTLNRDGVGRITIGSVPEVSEPKELVMEASYADPNGEVQTLRSSHTLWPSGVVAGIKTEGWVSARNKIRFQALALQHDGKPASSVPLKVQAIARSTTTTRKRLVGGFYSYDNKVHTKDLGTLCSGMSDARGLLLCESNLDEPGEVELVVSAADRDNNTSTAAASVWVTRQGELWFGGEDHDRMDLLPEKKTYQPGEVAKFQVRMPFRFATALVAVEREGIIDTQVVQLNGQDPTVSLKVQPDWGPNVYVSVLALRGRLREVPWYSFFTWGYKVPREWWSSFWHEGKEYQAPTALVDLSKPAFRLGMAEIRVGTQAHQIDVKVSADKESYPVRGSAQVTITATLPGGRPAAHAEVALAAVDQALLELMPNTSWNLLDAMLQRRAWGVETSTAQTEIIGRRHYGRKAVPAGGGGGRAPTRELLDTLLLWQPAVALDANGQARVTVPLNDALTSFRIVAVADSGAGLFGSGSTSIRATQDLQIISGLPPLVRDDDRYRAQITLRNTTQAGMQVLVTPRVERLNLQPQTVDVPAGQSREVFWDVTAPSPSSAEAGETLLWEIEARDSVGGARDAVALQQRLAPAVPLAVQQATLLQVDARTAIDVQRPAEALEGRGGLQLAFQARLADGLPGVQDWWQRYPYSCLEQRASRAIGLRDAAQWQTVVAQLPAYLDGDGLAYYFPPRGGGGDHGSDTLTAYLLAASHEMASMQPAFTLPDAVRSAMESGLIAFVEGRVERQTWSPRRDLDVRKLAAIEALSRYGKAQARMLGSIAITPNEWPTHAVIDWWGILRRLHDVPARAQRLAEVQQILRARLSFQGSKLAFSTEQDDQWWWLMHNADVNSARLLLAVVDEPGWADDVGRLASGFLGRQQSGAWSTTTANLWGALAIEKFSARFEPSPVTGRTQASWAGRTQALDWGASAKAPASETGPRATLAQRRSGLAASGASRTQAWSFPWEGAEAKALVVAHQGAGRPWLTLQSVAAVPRKSPLSAGYTLTKTVTPIEQANKALAPGQYTRGDVLRVSITVQASADMRWVAITDPIPGGAAILGSGLGRDSVSATQGERRGGAALPAFEERSFASYRSYYEYLPRGASTLEYTVRLNNSGSFSLPPTRVEALYAPEMFGELPNHRVQVAQP